MGFGFFILLRGCNFMLIFIRLFLNYCVSLEIMNFVVYIKDFEISILNNYRVF